MTRAPNLDSFGGRLAHAITLASSTRKAVAEALKTSQQAVGQVITGDTKAMTAENCARAARFLNVDGFWLASGEGDPHPAATPEFSSGERTFIAALRKLPPTEQEELLRDVLARADRVDEIVRQALQQRGIPAQTGAIQASLIGYMDRGFRNGKSDNDRRVAKQGDRRGHPGTTSEGGGG